MTWYETFLWLHVTMTVVWVGGGFALQVLALRVLVEDDPVRTAGLAGDFEFLGTRVFMPASLVLLLSGIALVVDGNWDWGEPFVSIGLLVWLVSFVAGAAYLGPTSGKIKRAVEAGGAGSPEVRRLIGNVLRYSRLELVLLLVVVFMMTVKLGT